MRFGCKDIVIVNMVVTHPILEQHGGKPLSDKLKNDLFSWMQIYIHVIYLSSGWKAVDYDEVLLMASRGRGYYIIVYLRPPIQYCNTKSYFEIILGGKGGRGLNSPLVVTQFTNARTPINVITPRRFGRFSPSLGCWVNHFSPHSRRSQCNIVSGLDRM